MSDLPNAPTYRTGIQTITPRNIPSVTIKPKEPVPAGGGISGKEKEGNAIGSSELPITDIGKEAELSEEVTAAGVKTQPIAINIPKPVARMGVQPAGQNVTIDTGSTVALSLTDEQIAQGLKESIASSWRWLSEWWKRKFEQLGLRRK